MQHDRQPTNGHKRIIYCNLIGKENLSKRFHPSIVVAEINVSLILFFLDILTGKYFEI